MSQLGIVDHRHVDKLSTTEQWTGASKVQMIFKGHPFSGAHVGVQNSGGIGQNQGSDARSRHEANSAGDFLGGPAFIKMDASLGDDETFPREFPEKEASLVAWHGRQW